MNRQPLHWRTPVNLEKWVGRGNTGFIVFSCFNRSGVKSVNREVPVFGHYEGIFFLGKIDELRMETVDGGKKRTLTLEEFKTRSQPRLPGKAQKETHELQLMLYKHFVDEIVSADGDAAVRRADMVCESLGLDKNLPLGSDLVNHFLDSGGETAICLKELFAKLERVGKGVPKVSKLVIDYAFQVCHKC